MTPYDAIRAARRKTVGTKQTMKAVARARVEAVYVARDADAHVVRDLIRLCEEQNVPIIYVDSMAELGRACGISVGAAAAGVVRDEQPVA